MRTKLISILIGISLSVTSLPTAVFAAPITCECVRYLREVLGADIRGDAWTQVPNKPTQNVEVGDVLLTKYGKVSHASLVIDVQREVDEVIDAENFTTKVVGVTVAESNYVKCTPGTRTIAISDVHIRGVKAV